MHLGLSDVYVVLQLLADGLRLGAAPRKLCMVPSTRSSLDELRPVMRIMPQIIPTCIFNKKDPIVLGVEVVEGIAKVWGRGCCFKSVLFC